MQDSIIVRQVFAAAVEGPNAVFGPGAYLEVAQAGGSSRVCVVDCGYTATVLARLYVAFLCTSEEQLAGCERLVSAEEAGQLGVITLGEVVGQAISVGVEIQAAIIIL